MIEPRARRRAGLVAPLFAIPSRASWGIGELPDLARLAPWMKQAEMSVLQILPITEATPVDQSPYSGLSAMAIDPQYIGLASLPDFTAAGGEAALAGDDADQLSAARRSRTIRYDLVRPLKRQALRLAFDRFHDEEWSRETRRAASFASYVERESWWLDDYALFRALHAAHGGKPWLEWGPALSRRRPDALESSRRTLAREILLHQYVQWVAEEQWQRARREASPIAVFGDLPFMVAADSADVWVHQEEFRLDASIGTPPDAFSETGQNWGLPAYRWGSHPDAHVGWLARRARRNAALFDGLRIDHVVGFYRTYVIDRDDTRGFVPPDEPSQLDQGERILGMFVGSGADITVEDLGTIPDFVRTSLARLNLPGYRVFRWERSWQREGAPFIDPASFPAASVATTGTHDIEPLAVWWDQLLPDERAAVGAIPGMRRLVADRSIETAAFDDALRDAFLELLFGSGSDLLLLPIQDVFGWRERINVPATVAAANWSYRLPWPLEDLETEPAARDRCRCLAMLARQYGRAPGQQAGSGVTTG
jgi:4-alpha-glucanotransferase